MRGAIQENGRNVAERFSACNDLIFRSLLRSSLRRRLLRSAGGRVPVRGSEFITKADTLQGGSSEFVLMLN
jgi:hypothetical protein